MAVPVRHPKSSTTGNVPNTAVCNLGQLALNLVDFRLFSSNGTAVFDAVQNVATSFNVGQTLTANVVSVGNSSVNTIINSSSITVKTVVANGSIGSSGQVLASNGTATYWSTPIMGSNATATYATTVDKFTGNATAQTFVLSLSSTTNNTPVSINGVDQVPGTSYSIVGNSLIFTFVPANNAAIVARTPNFSNVALGIGSISIANTTIESGAYSTSALTQAIADSFSATVYRSAQYFIQVTDNTNSKYHATQITLIHNGSATFMTEYGTIFDVSSLAVFDSSYASGNVNLLVTPTVANSTIKISRTMIKI